MNLLAIGDLVSPAAVAYVTERLFHIRDQYKVDFTVVNAENASTGNGLDTDDAHALLDAGADVLTGGNHSMRKRNLYPMLDSDPRLLRPANMSAHAPGVGYGIYRLGGDRILVLNLIGRMFLDGSDCPFDAADRILEREAGRYDYAVVDFHAEATSEKIALARYLDGRVSAFFGTHTHVATADEQILPGGTGYITDLGFTGVQDSVLGVRSEIIIDRFRTHLPARFEFAQGSVTAHGALFTLDSNGHCTAVERIVF